MNRDAKIGIVVILIIVGLLVIIWGRGQRDEELLATDTNNTLLVQGSLEPENRLRDPGTPGGPSTTFREPELVPDSTLVLPTPAVTHLPTTLVTPTPTPDPQFWTYTVVKGDMLELIAREQLGDRKRFAEIAQLNHLTKPYALSVGQKLKMPPKGAAPAVAVETPAEGPKESPRESPKEVTKTRRYVVQRGDMGIVEIARQQLGDPSKWKTIADLNHLTKPFELTPGQELLLPE